METNSTNENFLANHGALHDDKSKQEATSQAPEENPDMTDRGTEEGYYSSDPDKYLAMEQPGVTYTSENSVPLLTSDDIEDGVSQNPDLWEADKKNSRNSEAFNQDEYILNENIDFDEDQNQSISSDDI
ncbi:MAG TPA: hypothetical protein VFQ50_06925 [Flavobacterium sp.]|nr:hypothetical protein [Flavobacterium sp.]